MSKTLASIYPLQLGPEYRPFFQPQNIFQIAGVEYGAPPALLAIEESYEIVEALLSKSPQRRTITAEEIANDLLNCWTRGWHDSTPNQAQPGVWLCAGDHPAPEEIRLATVLQTAFLNRRIQRGNELWAEPKKRTEIDTHMKAAARWMRVSVPWLEDLTAESNTTCPYCANLIPKGTIKCPKCMEIVDMARYAEMEAAKQKAMADASAKLLKTIPPSSAEPAKTLAGR